MYNYYNINFSPEASDPFLSEWEVHAVDCTFQGKIILAAKLIFQVDY